MFGTSTVTTKGQATFPQDLRLMLGIKPGDKLYFEADLQTKTIKVKKASKSIVDELYGCLPSKMGYVDIKTVRKVAGRKLGEFYAQKLQKKSKDIRHQYFP